MEFITEETTGNDRNVATSIIAKILSLTTLTNTSLISSESGLPNLFTKNQLPSKISMPLILDFRKKWIVTTAGFVTASSL